MPPKDSNKKSNRRKNPYGEGSIYKVESGRFKDKWIGKLIIGTNPETGKPMRRSFYGDGWTEVRDKMKAAKAELDKGVNLKLQANLTFGEWLLTWMETHKKIELELTTWENYYRTINTHIYPAPQNIPLNKLTTNDIQMFYNKLIDQGKAPATVRRNHQIIHSCLEKAIVTHLISRNPSAGVTLPKLENKEARAMSMEEMDKFLDLLLINRIGPTYIGPKWRAAFLLLLGTGLREGEILALKWENIDLRNWTISIKEALARTKKEGLIFKTPKTKKSKRTIPLPLDVAVALRLHRIHQRKEKLILGNAFQDRNLAFCTSKGTPINPRSFTRKFEALRKRAGLSTDINLHALRHTYATRLLERGESLKTVQELLGHEDISTTGNTYAHVMPEIKKQAATNLNSMLKRKKASPKGEATREHIFS